MKTKLDELNANHVIWENEQMDIFGYSKYQKARDLAENETNVTFVGRLAQYKYFNMDQVVGAALVAAQKIITQG